MSARLATPCVVEDDFDLLILSSPRIAAMARAHESTFLGMECRDLCVLGKSSTN